MNRLKTNSYPFQRVLILCLLTLVSACLWADSYSPVNDNITDTSTYAGKKAHGDMLFHLSHSFNNQDEFVPITFFSTNTRAISSTGKNNIVVPVGEGYIAHGDFYDTDFSVTENNNGTYSYTPLSVNNSTYVFTFIN